MIDIHCHILPGLDDGPAVPAETLAMARMAAADGIRRIVATPHVKEAGPSPQVIKESVARLNRTLEEEGIPLEILPGADTSAALNPQTLKDYTINGTDYVLFEFPHTHLPKNAGECVFRAIIAGLRPIITHPERNPSILQDPHLLLALADAGALVQVTAGSLTGGFGPESRECAYFLLKKRAIHFLATDAHSCHLRRPVLSDAFRAAASVIGKGGAWDLVSTHPARVLAGQPIYA